LHAAQSGAPERPYRTGRWSEGLDRKPGRAVASAGAYGQSQAKRGGEGSCRLGTYLRSHRASATHLGRAPKTAPFRDDLWSHGWTASRR